MASVVELDNLFSFSKVEVIQSLDPGKLQTALKHLLDELQACKAAVAQQDLAAVRDELSRLKADSAKSAAQLAGVLEQQV